MRVIKHGKLVGVTYNFACDVCGCEFEVGAMECERGYKYGNIAITAKCPECGREIMIFFEDE